MLVDVRPERPADAAAVRRVHVQAFGRAAEADLVDALRTRGAIVCGLVAAAGEEVVGHVAYSPVTIETARGPFSALGLGPVAVLPPWQRRGVGSSLVRAGLAACGEGGHAAVVVLGNPAYYPRFGFVPARVFELRCGYDAPADAFMALELRTGALAGRAGFVRYRPEFDAV